VSTVQGLPSSQFTGVPTHVPTWVHVSFSVHALPSLHASPAWVGSGAQAPVNSSQAWHWGHSAMQAPRQTMFGAGHSAQWKVESQNLEQHSALKLQFAPSFRHWPLSLHPGTIDGQTHWKVSVLQMPKQQSALERQFSKASRHWPLGLQVTPGIGGHPHVDVTLSQKR
jgi:hypothetical protein